jgi:hypothetical protein
VGAVREQLTKRAADLSGAEREQDRILALRAHIGQLQGEVDAWLKRADGLEARSDAVTDVARRRARLQEALARYLRELGHNAITPENIDALRLDDEYVPYLGARRLHSLGSASDQSRLIAAYSLALADASPTLGGLHPGFVVLDEPLQQNPDDEHRELLFSSLTGELAAVAFQLVIFTWLPQGDIDRLREAGIHVITPQGHHFLSLRLAAESQDAPSSSTLDETEADHSAPDSSNGEEPSSSNGPES